MPHLSEFVRLLQVEPDLRRAADVLHAERRKLQPELRLLLADLHRGRQVRRDVRRTRTVVHEHVVVLPAHVLQRRRLHRVLRDRRGVHRRLAVLQRRMQQHDEHVP